MWSVPYFVGLRRFYIAGEWVDPDPGCELFAVINPATERCELGSISLATSRDVSRAVTAAVTAFSTWCTSSKQTRLALLRRLHEIFMSRYEEMAQARPRCLRP